MTWKTLKIGIGAVIENSLISYDYDSKENLRPYLCKITGRDFTYGLRREFVDKQFIKGDGKLFYENKTKMKMIVFGPLQPNVVYEYKRFPGLSYGEIEEGYFAILSDSIKELSKEQVLSWCGTKKDKEKNLSEAIFAPNK